MRVAVRALRGFRRQGRHLKTAYGFGGEEAPSCRAVASVAAVLGITVPSVALHYSRCEDARSQESLSTSQVPAPGEHISYGKRFQLQTAAMQRRDSNGQHPPLLDLGGGKLSRLGAAILGLCQAADRGPAALPEAVRHWSEFASCLQSVSEWMDSAPIQEGGRAIALLLKWRYYVNSLFCNGVLDEKRAQQVAVVLQQDFGVSSVVDPMAGSGWHAALLKTAGLNVLASDLEPGPVFWSEVRAADATGLPWSADHMKTAALWLSWPQLTPTDVGAEVLRCFRGRVLVYFGEPPGEADAVTGGEEFHAALLRDWELQRRLDTIAWPGFRDSIYVFTRKGGAT
eukprot:TRINITY_DN74477_c0_g1_i1.p1 TRINITY_DN74477_c0_g1~~TRINITY_DN74477_c0_g1_i1.p1  ORF type:complete len:341 (+),score=36.66 TRINITY_DN74477_c0_g1_i1:130-1152(+)